MSYNIYKCKNGCCDIHVNEAKQSSTTFYLKNKKKAGAFIFDPINKKILLVQSRGLYWGSPKGSIEKDETTQNCAIREVKEETGIEIKVENFLRAVTLYKRATYYYIEMKSSDVVLQNQDGNDANGIGWINVECLKDLVLSGNITINNNTRILIKKFLNFTISGNTFTKTKYNN
jgi:ADP-ribose pyrophosphatase YjhB (NUDIX family)